MLRSALGPVAGADDTAIEHGTIQAASVPGRPAPIWGTPSQLQM